MGFGRAVPCRPTQARIALGLAVVFAALVSVSGSAGASDSSASFSNTTNVQAFMTLYGYADNSPPGTDIAHPCIHTGAGGTGTYSDPITFATDVSELGWCVVIYVPYMDRYFIHEDECSECDRDWNQSHLYRFDMWAGGDAASLHQPERQELLRCESNWTRGNSISDPDNPTVIVDPPPDLPVTTDPIFSPPTTCWQPITVTNPGKQTTVLGDGPVSEPVTAADTTPGETLEYRAVDLPVGLSIDPTSGLISGSPTVQERTRVTVSAFDTYDSASTSFEWIVKNPIRGVAR